MFGLGTAGRTTGATGPLRITRRTVVARTLTGWGETPSSPNFLLLGDQGSTESRPTAVLQSRGEQTDQQKQEALEFDQTGRSDVFHDNRRAAKRRKVRLQLVSALASFEAADSHSAVKRFKLSMTEVSSRLIWSAAPDFS